MAVPECVVPCQTVSVAIARLSVLQIGIETLLPLQPAMYTFAYIIFVSVDSLCWWSRGLDMRLCRRYV